MGTSFKRVSRADVARHAGVSETIVSYVLNNNRYVDKTKRERVEQAIRELHYLPNNSARALKGKRSNQIIFIADKISNEHFGRIIAEMDQSAYEYGYLVSLVSNRNNDAFISHIISRQVDGIVISSISFSEKYINQLAEANIPIVLLMNREYHQLPPQVGKIDTGLYDGMCDCVNHLYAKKRRKILYIDRYSKNNNFSNMEDLRYRAFVEQMQRLGLEFSAQNIITGCQDENEVFERVRSVLQSEFLVDGIIGRNDSLACIAMEAAKSLGKTIPQDIALVGFDNSSLSRYTEPQLTTVEIQRDKIGQATIEMLHKMITGQQIKNLKFTTRLIERHST